MEKSTNALGIGVPEASVTLKVTVEVVVRPEPCTPTEAGVADTNWIPPAVALVDAAARPTAV